MPADTSQPSLKEVLRQKRAEYILEVAETVLSEKGYRDASSFMGLCAKLLRDSRRKK